MNLLAKPADGGCEKSVIHILHSLQENTNLYEFLGSFIFISFGDIYEESGNRVHPVTGGILNNGSKVGATIEFIVTRRIF